MRIVTYDLEKDENDMPMLVKESSQNCPSISNSIICPYKSGEIHNSPSILERQIIHFI